eukprot:Pgem_evm1s9226
MKKKIHALLQNTHKTHSLTPLQTRLLHYKLAYSLTPLQTLLKKKYNSQVCNEIVDKLYPMIDTNSELIWSNIKCNRHIEWLKCFKTNHAHLYEDEYLDLIKNETRNSLENTI